MLLLRPCPGFRCSEQGSVLLFQLNFFFVSPHAVTVCMYVRMYVCMYVFISVQKQHNLLTHSVEALIHVFQQTYCRGSLTNTPRKQVAKPDRSMARCLRMPDAPGFRRSNLRHRKGANLVATRDHRGAELCGESVAAAEITGALKFSNMSRCFSASFSRA